MGAVLFFGALLFYDKLTQPLKDWFVPSLAVYVVGTSIVAYIQTMLLIRIGLNQPSAPAMAAEQTKSTVLPGATFFTIATFHVLWFGLLIGYNIYRGSL
jgi:hypothetical protein